MLRGAELRATAAGSTGQRGRAAAAPPSAARVAGRRRAPAWLRRGLRRPLPLARPARPARRPAPPARGGAPGAGRLPRGAHGCDAGERSGLGPAGRRVARRGPDCCGARMQAPRAPPPRARRRPTVPRGAHAHAQARPLPAPAARTAGRRAGPEVRRPPAPGLLQSEASICEQGRRWCALNGGRRAASAVTPAGGGAAAGAARGAAGPQGGRRPGRGALVPARGPEGRRKARAGHRAHGHAERRAFRESSEDNLKCSFLKSHL